VIELAASICMISSPLNCRDLTLNFEADNVTPMACMMNGQIALSQWTNDHPNWRVEKFSCRPAGQVAKL
jgi:hypothetical protein